MMKTKLTIILFLILLFNSTGCKKGLTENPDARIIEDLQTVEDTIETSTDIIGLATKDIKKEADSITKEATEVQVPIEAQSSIDSIKKSSDVIKEDATKIEKASAKLIEAQGVLEVVEKKVEISQDALDKITKERDDAIKARDSALHKAIRWLIMACIVGAGALGMFGFMYGNRLCLTLSAVCIVIMSIAIFVETYFIFLVIGGGIILAGLVGLTGYQIYLQKKAFKEVVDTVEVTQDNLPEEVKKKLFGGVGETGIMDGLQSKSTMNLVQKEKNKMSNLWYYAKINKKK